MSRHKAHIVAALLMLIAALLTASIAAGQTADRKVPEQARHLAPAPASLRLYVFDCGKLKIADTSVYGFAPKDLATTDMPVPCFLAAHPKGTLIWDTGVLPDRLLTSGGSVTQGNPGSSAMATVARPLKAQLAEAGYAPGEITYLALSHCHWDHTANANDFAGATWLVRQEERDAMFTQPPAFARCLTPENYGALKDSKTVILNRDEYDVFGDGTVIIKSAPGHTPGHQVLFVKLRKTGPVLLSGDLYHYPEERTEHRVPKTDFNREQTAASRLAIEAFLKKTGAQLWIQHDFTANAKLKKAPAYYE
ncbi:MAG: MBL fold hydrolase [Acidobacteria bacterium]|nr:MAG: MBL fold hydrolase [Acidobacteriota bacterium]